MPMKVIGAAGLVLLMHVPAAWACAPVSFERGLQAASEAFMPVGACSHAWFGAAAPPRFTSPVPRVQWSGAPIGGAMAWTRQALPDSDDSALDDGLSRVHTAAQPHWPPTVPAHAPVATVDLSQVPPPFAMATERPTLFESPAVFTWLARVTGTDRNTGSRAMQAGMSTPVTAGPFVQLIVLLMLAAKLLRRRWADNL